MVFNLDTEFTEKFTITEEIYQGFLKTFKDQNPLHTIDSFALEKGFEKKVMHGNILNGFLSFFIGERLPIKNVIIHSQSIQFKKPVYMLDELVFSAIVVGVYESVSAVEFKFQFKNNDSKIIAKGKIQIGVLK